MRYESYPKAGTGLLRVARLGYASFPTWDGSGGGIHHPSLVNYALEWAMIYPLDWLNVQLSGLLRA